MCYKDMHYNCNETTKYDSIEKNIMRYNFTDYI